METINGTTVILPDPGGAASEAARGPVEFGPDRTGDYVAMPAGDQSPPLHIHPHTDEALYVAEGELTFRLGDRDVVAGAGSIVFVPRGIEHTARNSGTGPMRGMIILSPGAAEHLFLPVEAA